jgi:predicted naringenin-chalcone synthase
MTSVLTCINRMATALPPHEAHAGFLRWADGHLPERRDRALLRRMAGRSGIEQRWSVLPHDPQTGDHIGPDAFYGGPSPSTAARMAVYATHAPDLCVEAALGLGDLTGVTHLVLASCTGFIAPGIDQIVVRRLGLPATVERTLVGFMGCYAAVAALRTAHHIVRSQPDARVLVITVELCSLHLQPTADLEPVLAQMLFGDGAAAALVSAEPVGLAFGDPFAAALPGSHELITWTIGDHGFAMHLSGAVPARILAALDREELRTALGDAEAIDTWAVHAGGRSVLDAVEQGLGLPGDALDVSREVLRTCGNMSSATLMFVLARILASDKAVGAGLAMAFGPGLAVEGFHFRAAA